MSSVLKQSMKDELQAVCDREGDPDLLNRIADEREVNTVEQLLTWIEEHQHPAMVMDPMF